MTQAGITGYGDVLPAKLPATGGGAWRGLAFRLLSGTVAAGGAWPIEWDSKVADSDGIASGSNHTFSGYTALADQHAVIPAGMAGLWELAINLTIRGFEANFGQLELLVIKNDFEDFWDFILEDFSGVIPDTGLTLNGALFPWVLDEGDVIWTLIGGPVHSGSSSVGPDSSFLLKYTGFVP